MGESAAAVTLRPMTDDDLPLLAGWLAEPGVAEWWEGEPSDLPSVRTNYAGHLDGSEHIHMTVIEVDGAPVGWLEWYWLHDHDDYAPELDLDPDGIGIDLAVGVAGRRERGIGRAALRHLVEVVLPRDAPTWAWASIDPDPRNERAVRCYAAAGFTPTGVELPNHNVPGTVRLLMRLDR